MNIHPDDHLHVILDALNELDRAIGQSGDLEPWNWYDPDLEDPKTSPLGYVAILRHAQELLNAELSKADGLRLITETAHLPISEKGSVLP